MIDPDAPPAPKPLTLPRAIADLSDRDLLLYVAAKLHRADHTLNRLDELFAMLDDPPPAMRALLKIKGGKRAG